MALKAKYLSENKKSVMRVEKQFLSLPLLPNHQIEDYDYFTKIMDKGWKIGKTSQEVLLKFK